MRSSEYITFQTLGITPSFILSGKRKNFQLALIAPRINLIGYDTVIVQSSELGKGERNKPEQVHLYGK